MLIRLFPDSLFDMANPVLNLAGILFSSAISFQVRVLGKLADGLLDCPFDFVEFACCLIVTLPGIPLKVSDSRPS